MELKTNRNDAVASWLRLGLVTVLVAATGFVVIGENMPRGQTLSAPLKQQLPASTDLPGWSVDFRPVSESEEMRKAVAQLLNYDDAVHVVYTQENTRISVYAAYWQAGKMPYRLIAGHTPDVCWMASGWNCDYRGTRTIRITSKLGNSLPIEHRIFQQNSVTEHVLFCHKVGGDYITYGTGREPPWFALFSDLFTHGLRQREEQLFLRISSNQPLNIFARTSAFQAIISRLPL